MVNKRSLLLLLLLFLLGLIVIVPSRNNSGDKSYPENFSSASTSPGSQPTHRSAFFDKDTFYAGVEKAKNEDKVFADHLSGGVVPHDLFPGFIIADFFYRLSKQPPKTIILVGPNHYEHGNYQVLSSFYGWETPFGIVEPNEQVVRELVKSKLVKIDEDVLPKDHAVAGIMPFIKYCLPDAKVVPVLLSGFMTEADIQTLSNDLKNYLNKDTVIIAAADFSHYLTNQQAQEKDKVTLGLMKDFNYRQLLTLSNGYLDSPPSIAVLLMTMKAQGTTRMELLYHTNSGEVQKKNSIGTTSYFSIAYY